MKNSEGTQVGSAYTYCFKLDKYIYPTYMQSNIPSLIQCNIRNSILDFFCESKLS